MSEPIELTQLDVPDLSGRRVVIAGGTGSVGEGILHAWLEAGAQVVLPSRSEAGLEQFRQEVGLLASHPNLRTIAHDYTTFSGAERLAEVVTEQLGPVTDVIASIGGWWQGKALWEISGDDWARYFIDLTTSHVATARAWIPNLSPEGSYQLILGGSATTPVAGSSIINMEQAALKMMQEVLVAETGAQRRVFALLLGPVQTRTRKWVDPDWVSNLEAGFVTVGAAARTSLASSQFVLRNTDDLAEVLESLGMLPAGVR